MFHMYLVSCLSAAVAAAAALIGLCSPASTAGRRCPAKQTGRIKRACVVLSLTPEWGTEEEREREREKKKNKGLWGQMIKVRGRQRRDAQWNEGMEWKTCSPEKVRWLYVFLDSPVNFHREKKNNNESSTQCVTVVLWRVLLFSWAPTIDLYGTFYTALFDTERCDFSADVIHSRHMV